MRLLIIDPNCSSSSPSMKGVVLSLQKLKSVFTEVEIWCWNCDPGLTVDKVVTMPRWGLQRIPMLGYEWFALTVKLRAWWLFTVCRKERHDVVYTVASYFTECDVCHVHFSQPDWERRQQMLGVKSLRDVYERVRSKVGLFFARRFLRHTSAKVVLCVSRSVAEDVRVENSKLNIQVLPNCYDANRFHSGVRDQWRKLTRERLGFNKTDKVFIFVSAGHYRRKGFFLAVEALAELRKKTSSACFLLVVGGTDSRLSALQNQLGKAHPDWRDFVKFTGMVSDVEKYYAASDALLFPSYSEAFALVEVESAACGLPLFLTRHHGAEMILEEGRNGRYIEFDATQIAEVLAEFVNDSWCMQPAKEKLYLDNRSYAKRLTEYLEGVADMKSGFATLSSSATATSPHK